MNEKLLAELKKQDPARLTSEMVRIKSYSFMENQEDEISQYILDFFLERNIRAYRTEIVPGRFNVFAILEGIDRENSPSLMLTGHMDTVPAWTDAGFMNHYTDCHCIILGPGELALAHSIHEKVSVDELEVAARIYAEMTVDYCGVQE